jgi:uncharacterized protein (DUF427 family)
MAKRDPHQVRFEPSPKRVRVLLGETPLADSLAPGLVFETGLRPVYYFPREDVRMDLLERTDHRTHCPWKGDASYWSIRADGRIVENAVWGYEAPIAAIPEIRFRLAFHWNRVDHWLEEDEEIFGHARDPYVRVDVRPSSRRVRVRLDGRVVADTRRALFLFETGHPTRYYIPPADAAMELLTPTERRTVCPYKGTASYWSLTVGERTQADAVWSYLDPLSDCPRIKGYLCFYPDKVDHIEVEGAGSSFIGPARGPVP